MQNRPFRLPDSVFTESINFHPYTVRLAWVAIFALVESRGVVRDLTAARLAHEASIEFKEAVEAFKILTSPDPHDAGDPDGGLRLRRIGLTNDYQVVRWPAYKAAFDRADAADRNRRNYEKRRTKVTTEFPPEIVAEWQRDAITGAIVRTRGEAIALLRAEQVKGKAAE